MSDTSQIISDTCVVVKVWRSNIIIFFKTAFLVPWNNACYHLVATTNWNLRADICASDSMRLTGTKCFGWVVTEKATSKTILNAVWKCRRLARQIVLKQWRSNFFGWVVYALSSQMVILSNHYCRIRMIDGIWIDTWIYMHQVSRFVFGSFLCIYL